MVAAVIRRRGVQTRIHQEILESKKKQKRKLFVSIHETPKYSLENVLKEGNERQKQHDERFFTLIDRMLTVLVTTTQPTTLPLIVLHITILCSNNSSNLPTTYPSKKDIGKTIKKYPTTLIIQ